MGFVKRNAVAVGIGVAVLIGGSYVGAKALTTPQTVSLDSASSAAASPPAADASTGHQRGPIRGEAVIARRNGTFPTVRFNRGILQSVDGTTLVISEADGTTVNVATSGDTHFRRDHKRASLSDLQPGDHVMTAEVKEGDSYATKFVRAFSPDAWAHDRERRGE